MGYVSGQAEDGRTGGGADQSAHALARRPELQLASPPQLRGLASPPGSTSIGGLLVFTGRLRPAN
jgi:hypothetical protein